MVQNKAPEQDPLNPNCLSHAEGGNGSKTRGRGGDEIGGEAAVKEDEIGGSGRS